MLRRGSTATSLSLPGHQSTAACMKPAMYFLREQGLCLYHFRKLHPRVGISILGKCLANGCRLRPNMVLILQEMLCSLEHAVVLPILALKHQGVPLLLVCTSYKVCIGELMPCGAANFEKPTGDMTSCMQVVNMIAPMRLGTHRLFQGTSLSSFSRLRHLTLMMDPIGCLKKPSQLNIPLAKMGSLSQLESLYIGFTHGYCCSRCGFNTYGGRSVDAEDSIDLCLSSMQHLASVHLDSFWPALLELPPKAFLHATFKSAPGQMHPGLWAGRLADVQNSQIPLRSVHFLPGPPHGLDVEYGITATELWPLKIERSIAIESVRVMAGTLHLDLSDFPGLMQAERVLITASECHLTFPSNQLALKHLAIRHTERLRLVISNIDLFAAHAEDLTLSRKDSMDTCPVSVLFLRNAVLAAASGNEVLLTSRRTKCQPESRKKHWRYGWGSASLRIWSAETSDRGDWAQAVRCCCHACLTCLHRDGVAAFPEAIAQENAMLGA